MGAEAGPDVPDGSSKPQHDRYAANAGVHPQRADWQSRRRAGNLLSASRNSIGLVDTDAPIPPGLDFNLWAGPAPLVVPKRKRFHYDWHWIWQTGNGDLGNQNPHELDKARWGLGKQELPKRVVSLGGRLGYIDNGDVANNQVIAIPMGTTPC